MIKKAETVISIAAIAFILYIFTFYIDGEIGIVLIAFLIVPPVISLIFALCARNRIMVSISSDAYVKKGSDLEVTVTVEKIGRLPIAVAEICPAVSEVFEERMKKYRLSLIGAGTSRFTFKVKAVTGGNGEISVKNLYSCGFLGFVRFRMKTSLPDPVSVGVIPEIPEVKSSSMLIRQIADAVMTSDDDNENDTKILFSSNSVPGYEHREYVQGDPLKRINWKLSSKKQKLMVRLDEAIASVQPMILLDLYRSPETDVKTAVLREEKLICAAMGLAKALVKQGISCKFAYSSGNETKVESVDDPDYTDIILLNILAEKVMPGRRIDSISAGSVCSQIVATTVPDPDIYGSAGGDDPGNRCIVVPGRGEYPGVSGVWYLDEADNTFKMV